MARILIVDQESRLHEALTSVLKPMGHEVSSLFDGSTAIKTYRKAKPEIVILEAELSGIDLLRQIRQADEHAVVILTTALPRKEIAISALRSGAFDLLLKPLNVKDFVAAINRALSLGESQVAAVPAAGEGEAPTGFQLALVGSSIKAEALRKQLHAIRDQRLRAPVLLQGGFGSGKRELAQYLHHGKGGALERFHEIDCKALNEAEIRAQLIGEDGGLGPVFSQYSGGTIVLERIEALPESIQDELAALAKAAAKEVFWICCSDIDLDEALADGEFSMKLYFQISGKVIDVPALRDRSDDIPEMITTILRESPSVPEACRTSEFTADAIGILQNHEWPENLLELERLVALVAMESKGGRVDAAAIRRKFPAAS